MIRNIDAAAPVDLACACSLLAELTGKWTLADINAAICIRAGQTFPVEPIRTLDALHLATLLELKRALRTITLLSCDERITANARALGIAVLPRQR